MVLVARRLRLPIVAVGIPALAGLSVLHGLVPPHPGPLVAIDALGANPGLTLLFGLATAIPTVLVAGPLIRVATGSATVATITAAGIVAPLAAGLDAPTVALLALAVGAGSLFFSHVNDAGFWLVKEYFGLTVGQTIKSWSMMETAISVAGLLVALLLSVIVRAGK